MMGLLLNVSKQASVPIPAKRTTLPFMVSIPKDNSNTIRGLDRKKRRQRNYEIEQQKKGRKRRR